MHAPLTPLAATQGLLLCVYRMVKSVSEGTFAEVRVWLYYRDGETLAIKVLIADSYVLNSEFGVRGGREEGRGGRGGVSEEEIKEGTWLIICFATTHPHVSVYIIYGRDCEGQGQDERPLALAGSCYTMYMYMYVCLTVAETLSQSVRKLDIPCPIREPAALRKYDIVHIVKP